MSRNQLCPCGSGKRYKYCHGIVAGPSAADGDAPTKVQADPVSILHLALAKQQAGDLASAEALYTEALEGLPGNFDAMHMLGVVKLQLGKFEDGTRLLIRGILSAPEEAMVAIRHNLGLCLLGLARERGILDSLLADWPVPLPVPFGRAHSFPEANNYEQVSIIVTEPFPLSRLQCTLDGICAQNHKNMEIVAAIPPKTVDYLELSKSLASRGIPFRLVGIDAALSPVEQINAAANACAGAYFCFLRAGDYWAPHWLDHMTRAIKACGVKWGFSGIRVIADDGSMVRFGSSSEFDSLMRAQDALYEHQVASMGFLSFNPIGAGRNLMISSELWRRCGGLVAGPEEPFLDLALGLAWGEEPVYVDEPDYLIPQGTEWRNLHSGFAAMIVRIVTREGAKASASDWREAGNPYLRQGISAFWANQWRRMNGSYVWAMPTEVLVHCAGMLGISSDSSELTVSNQLPHEPNPRVDLTAKVGSPIEGSVAPEVPAAVVAAAWTPRRPQSNAFSIRVASSQGQRLIGISCVGNEADIIEAFVRHNSSILDHLIILEHNTLDGTRDILDSLVAEGLPISVEHSSEPRFLQLPFTNRLLQLALTSHHADWVFPIDCDEFIVAPTRAELNAALVRAGKTHVRIKWINYVPTARDDATERHPLRRIRHCYDFPAPPVEADPWVWKVAVNAHLLGDYYLDRYELSMGNHFLALQGDQRPAAVPMPPCDQVMLAHFPVRSSEQLAIKTAIGLLARLGTGDQSEHYSKIWREITSGNRGFDALASAVRNFLESPKQNPETLQDTPVKLAPIPVQSPLLYSGYGLPAIAVMMKWVERYLLDEDQRPSLTLRPMGKKLPN